MKRIILALCSFVIALAPAYAQSAAEINAAKQMARSYGYSSTEIDQAINKLSSSDAQNGNQTVGNQTAGKAGQPQVITGLAGTVAMPPTSDVLIGMEDIPSPTTVAPIAGRHAVSSDIYGHDFFISDGLALIPSINAPIPASYRLGPGDDISIDIWGDSNANYSSVIGNDGTVVIQGLGPIAISGMTVSEAEMILKSRLSSLHSSLRGNGSKLHLSVNKIRGVTVYVLGEVLTPGVYTLPSLSSIATAVYMAGGIMAYGSVRNINLYRDSKLAGTFDLYDYIFKGKFDTNIRLQDGDIISVASSGNIVKVGGGLNRNFLKYEVKEGESVSDLITYAGGFTTDAYRDKVHIDRQNGPEGKSYDVLAEEFSTFPICSGDSVYVNVNIPKYTNRVYISGAVLRPGPYSISDKVSNVRQLIEAAGGLQEGAYTNRGYVNRRDADMKPANLSFNLERIMNGLDNIDLVRDDSVRVYTVLELQDSLTVTINGEVNAPGSFEYREGLTIWDVILMAGGVNDGGDISNVEVATRGRENPSCIKHYNLIERPEDGAATLQPFDLVSIRRRVNYRELQTITISGEVKYPGTYAIDKNSVRLSDVVMRAEGFTEDAYTKGAVLKRMMTEIDKEKARNAKELEMKMNSDLSKTKTEDVKLDSLGKREILIDSTYTVGINIDEALKNPGSYADIILHDGDEIMVPQLNNTVKISGGVNFPNTVAYDPSRSWKYYIHNAGGFTKSARKHKTYAIYMDGSSAVRGNSKFKMEPGMELVVPEVDKDDSGRITFAEVTSLTSSLSSMAYMAAILINLFSNK